MCSAAGVSRPIQIEEFRLAIKEMSDNELSKVRNEILNCVHHLNRSNSRLQKYIAKIQDNHYSSNSEDEELNEEMDALDSNDLQLYRESLQENEILLRNYDERITALDQEEIYRSSK